MEIKDNIKTIKVNIDQYNPRQELENIGFIQIFKGKHKNYFENDEIDTFDEFNKFSDKNQNTLYCLCIFEEDGELYCDEYEDEDLAVGVIYTTDEDVLNVLEKYDTNQVVDMLIDEVDLYSQYVNEKLIKVDYEIKENNEIIAKGTIFGENDDVEEILMTAEDFWDKADVVKEIVKNYKNQNEM